MQLRTISLVVAVATTTACASKRPPVAVPPAPAVESAPPGPAIAGGARLVAQLDTPIDANAKPGDTFYATVTEPLVDERGVELVPAGTKLFGRVGDMQTAMGGESEVVVEVQAVDVHGMTRPVSARIVRITEELDRPRMPRGEILVGVLGGGALIGLMFLGGGSLKDGGLAGGLRSAAGAPGARGGLRGGGVDTRGPLQLPRP